MDLLISAADLEFTVTPHRPGCEAVDDQERTCHCLRRILPNLPHVSAADARATWGLLGVAQMLKAGLLMRRGRGFYLSRFFSMGR